MTFRRARSSSSTSRRASRCSTSSTSSSSRSRAVISVIRPPSPPRPKPSGVRPKSGSLSAQRRYRAALRARPLRRPSVVAALLLRGKLAHPLAELHHVEEDEPHRLGRVQAQGQRHFVLDRPDVHGEVEARHDDHADYGASDYQPEDVHGRLPLYSSGAMVTRSPESSWVSSI